MDYEARTIIRNIIVSLVGLGLVVLVLILLIRGFKGGTNSTLNQINVGNYASSNSDAVLLIDGPTRLDQEHFQVRITVSGTLNQIEVVQGYQNNVIRSQTYATNTAAYAAFLQSLQLVNFSHGIQSDVDYRGYCPTGNRYVYSFSNNQSELFRYWSTSCGGNQGTFRGDARVVRQLFERQIAQDDLSTLTRGTNLSL